MYNPIDFKDKTIYKAYKRKQYDAKITMPPIGSRIYNKTRDTVSIVTEESPYMVTLPANVRYVANLEFLQSHFIEPDKSTKKLMKKVKKAIQSPKGLTVKSVPNDKIFYAVKVPENQVIYIYDEYGERQQGNFNPSVNHNGGDWVVCHQAENGGPDTDRMFVVNGELFDLTYSEYI